MARFDRLSICKGSPWEAQIPWEKGLMAGWNGCAASTFSDHTVVTELGWWALRERAEGILTGWLPMLGALLETDGQALAFDKVVLRKFGGKIRWTEGDPSDPVYRDAYALALVDPTISPPRPALSPQLAKGLARAARNYRAVFPNIKARLVREKTNLPAGWYGWNDVPTRHVDPPQTADMKAALSDMRATYSDVYGPNGRSESNPYWVAAQALLNTEVVGCPYQESNGPEGCDMREMPFDLRSLYFLDAGNTIYPKVPLQSFLDLFAPGWSQGLKKPMTYEEEKKADAVVRSKEIAARETEKKTRQAEAMLGAAAVRRRRIGIKLAVAIGVVGAASGIGYFIAKRTA